MDILYGNEIITQCENVGELGGFIHAAQEEPDVKLLPTIRADAWPSGLCDRETHQFLKQRLLQELRNLGPLDGILLSLHGAMSATDEYDVEGDLLTTIRDEWGKTIPLVISLDHHANITQRIMTSVTALVGYHTEPHIDMLETGYQAAKILFKTVRGTITPTMGRRKLPMIPQGDLCTTPGHPLAPFFDRIAVLEQTDTVLSACVFPVALVDTPELGWDTVVVTDNDPLLAQGLADDLARGIWEKRLEFLPKRQASPREAVEMALAIDGGPIILADRADATNSGASGDSTAILQALLTTRLQGTALLTIVDPEAVDAAIKVGVNAEIQLAVGGKLFTRNNPPVTVHGRVKRITNGQFTITGPMSRGVNANMGRTAVIEVDNISIIISEIGGPGHDPSLYRSVGLEPRDAKIVVVKSPFGFRAAYEPFAQGIIIVDGPGAATSHLESFQYKFAPRPIFPLDANVTFKI